MTSLPRFSVNNPVIVNLMMATVTITGTYSAFTLVREMFPETNPDIVSVRTIYPGATPAEVEKGISQKIEEVIRDIDGVEEIQSTNGEGVSSISAILESDVEDVDQIVTDVKAAIDTIPRDEFPLDAEEPQVTKFEPKMPVINVSYYGAMDPQELKEIGERIRDDILDIPGVTKVALNGTRKDEISIEVKPEKLVEYGLSLPDIAQAVTRANLDLPAGQIKTSTANIALRTMGEEDQARPIGETIVRSDSSGKVIRLSEVADVRDGFQDVDVISRFNAQPAITVTAYKTASQDAIDISRKIKAMVAGKLHRPMEDTWQDRLMRSLGSSAERDRVAVYERARSDPYPTKGTLVTSTNLASYIEGRIELLTRNGMWGLFWVFLSLLLFLNWRVAFWVMSGLLISVLGTFLVMKLFGFTLNLLSAFGLIVVLGLLVDDAIVVGEHVFTKVESGVEPKLAAIQGTEAVTWPVIAAIATTIVAFAPLMFIEGRLGDLMGILPMIVLCALSVSLFEALSILPSHLAEWLKPPKPRDHGTVTSELRGWASRIRGMQRFVLDGIMSRGYDRALRFCVENRYVTVAAMIAALTVSIGLMKSERVPFVFWPKMDSETLLATLEMPVGTPITQTDATMQPIETAVVQLPELDSMYTLLGIQYSTDGSVSANASHLAQAIIELKPIEQRDRTSEDIVRELREKTRNLSGVNSLKFSAMHGAYGGAPVQVEIRGDRLEDLEAAAERIKTELRKFTGVFDIRDDFDAGRREIQIELLDSARALDLTTNSLATQVRGAFFGLEAKIIQRDREDVKIMVRYPEAYRKRVYDLESMRVAAPDGTLVPFSEVARFTEGRGYATIRSKDQRRTVTVSADVDEDIEEANSSQINHDLAALFPEIEREFPGIQIAEGGQQEERAKSISSLSRHFITALLLIYAILAALFRSYVQPLVVMCAIPFGIIGVITGHMVMGFSITFMSLIGIVALSGIVVNDSLILMTFINRRRAEGGSAYEAVIQGGTGRLRAILLTSITTVLGLAPLLTETSFQARFLIPMGISIAAGLIFATILTLVGIPALYMILEDARRVAAAFTGFLLNRPPQNLDAAPGE